MKRLVMISVFLALGFACFASALSGSLEVGASSMKEATVEGRLRYYDQNSDLYYVFPVKVLYPLDGQKRVGRSAFSVGVAAEMDYDFFYFASGFCLGEMMGVFVYGGYNINEYTRIAYSLAYNVEWGTHGEYNWGEARGKYQKQYNEAAFELSYTQGLLESAFVSLSGGMIHTWEECWDNRKGKKYIPGTSKQGSKAMSEVSSYYIRLSVGFEM